MFARMLACFIGMLLLTISETSWCARQLRKKRVAISSTWYGTSDVTYSHWFRDRLEGGGESQVAGLQLGVNLPHSVSASMRFSAMPEPYGLLDARVSLSQSYAFNDALWHNLSSSLSFPASDYSKSVNQITQASLASTLGYNVGATTLSLTAYGTKAWYSQPVSTEAASASLNLKQPNKVKKPHPHAGRPVTAGVSGPDEALVSDDVLVYYDVPYETVRFDKLVGVATDVTWRFHSAWAVSTSGSLTRSTMSSGESVFSNEATLLQLTYSYQALSVFAGGGLLEVTPSPRWPRSPTLSAGMSAYLSE